MSAILSHLLPYVRYLRYVCMHALWFGYLLEYWMQEIIQNVSPPDPENFPFIVLANKVDVENRVVSYIVSSIENNCIFNFVFKVTERMAEKWAEQYNMPYVEVSAKDNINIDFAFKLLATNILKNSDNDVRNSKI